MKFATKTRTALLVAGGTGGHIFPGLAVANALLLAGWQVQWLGGRGENGNPSMEARLVPAQQIPFQSIEFSGVRGKGFFTLMRLPFSLLKAVTQCWAVFRNVKPDLVVGFGGYVTFPAGLVSALLRKPLVLHEQNSVAGMANRQLARFASRVFTAFPRVLPKGEWIGNPLRNEFWNQPTPDERFKNRSGPLRILVLGGSLGAAALNDTVPKAIALLPEDDRPYVLHQSGQKQFEQLQTNYRAAGVQASLTPFIDDVAQAIADADLLVCRAGASTVTELAAIGAAAIFVPFPAAVDDHQTSNARYLADCGGAILIPQSQFTPERLANRIRGSRRADWMVMAELCKKLEKIGATEQIVMACKELVSSRSFA